jgi:hypothetical protein
MVSLASGVTSGWHLTEALSLLASWPELVVVVVVVVTAVLVLVPVLLLLLLLVVVQLLAMATLVSVVAAMVVGVAAEAGLRAAELTLQVHACLCERKFTSLLAGGCVFTVVQICA